MDPNENGSAYLAAAFACAVTAPAEGCLVARNGSLSLFSAFTTIFPEVRMIHACEMSRSGVISDVFSQACYQGSRRHPVKGKIARTEFNKVLQRMCGFVCTRSRVQHIARQARSSCSSFLSHILTL